jgi:hypothetical protein
LAGMQACANTCLLIAKNARQILLPWKIDKKSVPEHSLELS